jgi:foldase protein PrsA
MISLALRRRRELAAATIGATLLVASACGGGSSSSSTSTTGTGSVVAGSIAQVASRDIPKSELDAAMARAKLSYVAQKRTFPKAGTSAYTQLQTQAVQTLVQQLELRVGGDRLGVSVTDNQVTTRLDQIKKQYFPGAGGKGVDDAKYQAALKQQGLTESALRDQIEEQLREQAIYNAITRKVTVPQSEIQKYYDQNRKTLYSQPASRHVRHILVKTKAEAEKLYKQLAHSDAKFAALAKKDSTDTGSGSKGGDLGNIQQGQTVPPFNQVAFHIKQGVVSHPVHSQFGYHLIEALGPVIPATVKPLDKALSTQIQTQLEQTDKQKAFYDWFQNLKKDLDPQVVYAAGYKPPPPVTSALGSTASTITPTTSTTG